MDSVKQIRFTGNECVYDFLEHDVSRGTGEAPGKRMGEERKNVEKRN